MSTTQTKTALGGAAYSPIGKTVMDDTDTATRRREALTPRMTRTLQRLLRGATMREELDRVAGASNSPDVVRQLRLKGLNIHCDRVDVEDRDGRPARPGRYSLAPESLRDACVMLGGEDG